MTVTRTVVPGDWYGVLGASVIVLLPPAANAVGLDQHSVYHTGHVQ